MPHDSNISYLRLHLTHLVRVWTVLGMFRGVKRDEIAAVIKDVCSDKLRVMLYELANKKSWTLGFGPEGCNFHKRCFKELQDANEWFTAGSLHARNCSGAHLQSLEVTTHMFQQFGYGGEREWRKLTKGVAACVAMMKLIEGRKHNSWWRELRQRVREGTCREFKGMPVPVHVDALLLDYKVDYRG